MNPTVRQRLIGYAVIFLTVQFFSSVGFQARAADCGKVQWEVVAEGVWLGKGCLMTGAKKPGTDVIESANFVSLRYDPTKYRIRLLGSRENNEVPTLEDSRDIKEDPNKYNLEAVSSRVTDMTAVVPLGYVISDDLIVPDGLVRISGKDVSERDTENDYKSALLCLNEYDKNTTPLSRFVVFNAFEKGIPIRLNERVESRSNCRDVVQLGPRIIEYRSKPGIDDSELKRKPEKYSIFAQGSGPNYFVYIVVFIDRINLFMVQKALLTKDYISDVDVGMRMAITISIRKPVAMFVRNMNHQNQIFGDGSIPHPLYLGIERATAVIEQAPLKQ